MEMMELNEEVGFMLLALADYILIFFILTAVTVIENGTFSLTARGYTFSGLVAVVPPEMDNP